MLFARYEKKKENYLGIVQLANSRIVYRGINFFYRRMILGY